MAFGTDGEKLITQEFHTEEGAERAAGVYRIRAARPENSAAEKARGMQRMRVSSFRKTADRFWGNKLLRNTAICAAAALVIWGIASSGTPAGQEAAGAIRSVIDYESGLDKDLGNLKFVDSVLEEDAALVMSESDSALPDASAEGTQAAADSASEAPADAPAGIAAGMVYPLDGIVTSTFAESRSGVIITATDSTEVKASMAGIVTRVSENFMTIQNEDSSLTTYYGVAAGVKKDENVQAGQTIGKLLTQTLYVERTLNGEKTDPLS